MPLENSEPLIRRLDKGVLYLTKDNAGESYGISLAMWRALTAQFKRAHEDNAVTAVVIDAGGPGFHRGAVMVNELKPSLNELESEDFQVLVHRGQALGRLIANLPKPVIGIARSGALGGGLELLLRCDFLYTTDAARFSFPEVTLGFVAAWGGTQWGGRMLAFRRAQEMLLLGEAISGARAAEIDLVTRSFKSDHDLDEHVKSVVERLDQCSGAAFAGTKRCLQALWSGPLAHGEQVEVEAETTAMAAGDFIERLSNWRRENSPKQTD
jgi:enoyl-CoA hydratase/carnithine racemase